VILTGSEIARHVACGNIELDPFDLSHVNPNSYNYRLGNTLKLFDGMSRQGRPRFKTAVLSESGHILRAGEMCLGHTVETIGSSRFAMSLIGRSSIGRLGLFVQISANLGHTTSSHRWTLELFATRTIRVYPHLKIGQVSFWANSGPIRTYDGGYATHDLPTESTLWEDAGRAARDG
jgi:dCTP deaminase